MGDFEAPSFSLGFDFDFDDTSDRVLEDVPAAATDVKTVSDGNDDEFEIETLTVADSDDENNEEVRPRLKRLRRGCSVEDNGLSGFGKCKSRVDLGSVVVDDDDIEDFSSPEDNNAKGKFVC